uniref:Retrotransposon gag domain-containing protein n=1 Tax=Nicotiana tabacum TaxID=4097 RepID=A0A1S3Y171_TOBAC|nr:PREDICTED: uncharacterized protein LOC107771154 [Nicotiana tabacum]
MRVALLVKNKLGFVDGTCLKSSFRGDLTTQWERYNAVVLSRLSCTVSAELVPSIMYASSVKKVWDEFKKRFDKCDLTRIYQLWTEITTLRQGIDSVTSYFSKLKDFWDELDILAPLPSCDCEESRPYMDHLIRQRLLQFLMGLNESYSHVRSDVLLKRPVLTVNQAYSIVVQEESQRKLGVVEVNRDPLTMLAGKSQAFKNKRPGLICEYCGYKGHLKENCYKIIGYPPDFKSKKKGQFNPGKPYANVANTYEDMNVKNQYQQGNFFTEDQYKQLVNMLTKSSASENTSSSDGSANLAGSRSEITHTGDAVVMETQRITNVLHVPDFKFNLLSVSKLTKELDSSMERYWGLILYLGAVVTTFVRELDTSSSSILDRAIGLGRGSILTWGSRYLACKLVGLRILDDLYLAS